MGTGARDCGPGMTHPAVDATKRHGMLTSQGFRGLADVRAFLSDLAVRQRVSASTQNQALAAITFLYAGVLRRPLPSVSGIVPASAPRRLPVVLSTSEARAIIERLGSSFVSASR